MESSGHNPLLSEGLGALDEARWADAKAAFEEALAERITPDALDGLARSLWWIGDTDAAVTTRTRAYTYFKREGRVDEASRAAVWLALEYSTTPGREALARGWLARAERLADDPGSVAFGWLALTRSTLEVDPLRMASHAEEALAVGRDHDDASLEIRALARAGLALVLSGRTEEGMARLDEAMTAAAAGESEHPEIFAETCCDMVSACEATLDMRRLEQWGQVAERFLDMRPHPDLLGFCGSCCASVLAARGDLTGAEQWLTWTINSLEGAGHESRCVDPRAKLAELRLGQGRVEEARRLLAGIEARPEATRVTMALYVMNGELGAASSLLHRRLAKIGVASTAAIPILAMLVPIQIERGDLAGAGRSAERIDELATQSGQAQHRAEADVARGRFALAKGATPDAARALFSAVEAYDHLGMPIHAARTRLYLAETLADSDPETAIAEARAASSRLDEAGITADADRADSLIRSLGGRGRVGPKQAGLLTRREQEVLSLIAEGLTNAEIAERLFISVKTAGNHVSHVLTKLNLRSRTEAAAFAHQNRSGVVLSPL
jgi:DNA-binding CsgD family transcriptional regulator